MLFLPTDTPELKEILSYFSSTITINAEGDTSISEETLEGLGRTSFLSALFGTIIKIADPPKLPRSEDPRSNNTATLTIDDEMYDARQGGLVETSIPLSNKPYSKTEQQELATESSSDLDIESKKFSFTDILPDPG